MTGLTHFHFDFKFPEFKCLEFSTYWREGSVLHIGIGISISISLRIGYWLSGIVIPFLLHKYFGLQSPKWNCQEVAALPDGFAACLGPLLCITCYALRICIRICIGIPYYV